MVSIMKVIMILTHEKISLKTWVNFYFSISAKLFVNKNLSESSLDSSLEEYLKRKKCFVDAYNGIDVGLSGFSVIQTYVF